ncbi:major facilitator superfamily domain-containing protein [Dactylonectria macrodidyma]|uniref:Major facilitator superfamily domain-containing protein n=1 Tax=Dactylonectria macrodidyma TaxID=307937 RepID=A0A9P9FNP6_9HYPO|nr:major facilitator superfamily domain-containing protein [Dactylonectria macrodidyma]
MSPNGESLWGGATPVLDQGDLEIRVDDTLPPKPTASSLSRDESISYLYLSFDSNLPSPQTPREGGLDDNEQLPPCPDLRTYSSPLTWPLVRKNILLALSCIATFLTAYTAGAYSPPSSLMAKDLGTTHLATLVGITTFCMGFAIAPMALAPISEIWGRYPVFIFAGVVYVIFQAVCPLMTNLAGMLVARFLVGVGGSVFSSVVGGVIADLWDKEERNTPMALFSGAVLAGTGAGPLVSAVFINGTGNPTQAWKWTFWHQVILDGVLVVALVFLFRESRGSVILSRKAKKLNQWYEELENMGAYGVWVTEVEEEPSAESSSSTIKTLQTGPVEVEYTSGRRPKSQRQLRRIRWVVQADEQRASLANMISTSVQRPFYLLFTEPVVFCFSIWAAFSWGVLYLSFAVVPYLYAGNLDMSSRVYAAMMASAVAATIVGVLQERLMKHPQWRKQEGDKPHSPSRFWAFMRKHFPAEAPEARLYFACVTSLLLPAGLFGAFLGPASTSYYAQAVGIGFANWGIYSVYLATFNYLADTYHLYASSALAAQSFCRNVLGGSFPIITGLMFDNLGLRNAGCVLGGIASGLSLIPWVLVFFGERIRSRSKFAIVSSQMSFKYGG